MKKQTWTDIKGHLMSHSSKELIDLVRDLYQANKQNQQFLHTRYSQSRNILSTYKETIARFVCPDPLSPDEYFSNAKAKKAISDYKKAQGKPECVADLEIYYCECVVNLLGFCSVDDEETYVAFEKMYARAIKSCLKLTEKQQTKTFERLAKIYQASEEWGWGVYDELTAIIEKDELKTDRLLEIIATLKQSSDDSSS